MSNKKFNEHTLEQWMVRAIITMLAWKCLGPEAATLMGLGPVPAVMAHSSTTTTTTTTTTPIPPTPHPS